MKNKGIHNMDTNSDSAEAFLIIVWDMLACNGDYSAGTLAGEIRTQTHTGTHASVSVLGLN